MLPRKKWNQYGLPDADIKGIVIHNTNNQFKSAEQLEEWLKNDNKGSNGCHFLIDHKEVRQVMPLTWSVWNTGDGYSFGNLHCIAVEICSNPNTNLYLQGQARAVELIKELMAKFKLTEKDIYYHRDFQPNINCPAQILKLYKSKSDFVTAWQNVMPAEYSGELYDGMPLDDAVVLIASWIGDIANNS